MILYGKEKNDLIESFKKFTYKKYNESYYFQIASQVYRSEKPEQEKMFDFNSYSNLNWHWFFTHVLNQDVHPKKVPLWEQSMYPWKKL